MLDIFYENYLWMTYNILLALIPVLLGWLVFEAKNKSLKIILFAAWLLFVPNTIYIFTDILHLPGDIYHVGLFGGILLILQYTILLITGFFAFIYSLYPVDKVFKSAKFIIILNFLIGFGVVLGRVHRLNSWDAVVSFGKLIRAATDVIRSFDMIALSILFGLLANFIYFLYRDAHKKI